MAHSIGAGVSAESPRALTPDEILMPGQGKAVQPPHADPDDIARRLGITIPEHITRNWLKSRAAKKLERAIVQENRRLGVKHP